MILEFMVSAVIGLVAGLGVREGILAAAASRRYKGYRWSAREAAGHKPGWQSIGRLAVICLPSGWLGFLERAWGGGIQTRIVAAGRRDIESADIIGLRLVLICVGLAIGLTWFASNQVGIAAGVIIALALQGWPHRWLEMKAEARRHAFTNLLPDFIELTAIGIEAGLSFDRSVELYCARFQNPVSETLSQACDEIALGKVRRVALESAVAQTQVEAFTLLVRAVLRAEKLGAPLAVVLREQARVGREQQEQMIRELSAKAPIKMLGPIAGLILPALMIVILGPALLRFM